MPRPLLPALLALAALAALPAAASASATVIYVPTGSLTVESTSPERNVIAIGREGDEIVITESGDPATLTVPFLSVCTASGKTVRCPDQGVTSVRVTLGPGDDGYTPPAAGRTPLAVSTTVEGEAGADALTGANVPETLAGNDGDDTLEGGGGNDDLAGDAGADTVAYPAAPRGVKVVLGEDGAQTEGNGLVAAGGAAAESDKVAGVERATGGPGPDELTGNGGPNGLAGGGGEDRLDGAGGADTLGGGAGADLLTGGPGPDELFGEGGDDTLVSRDGEADPKVDCGTAVVDKAVADNGADAVALCEFVAPQTVTPPALTGEPKEGVVLRLGAAVRTGTAPRTITREWFRCAPDRSACEPIAVPPEATTYRLAAADVDKVLFVRVTATNAAGQAVDETAPTPVIEPAVPRPPRQPGTRPPGTRPPREPDPVFGPGPAATFARLAAPSLRRRGTRLELTAGQRVTCRATNRDCGVDVVVTARLKVKARKGSRRKRTRTVELGFARRVLSPGASADLVFNLKKSARKALPAGKRVTLRVKIAVRQSGSQDSAVTRRLKVKVPRRG